MTINNTKETFMENKKEQTSLSFALSGESGLVEQFSQALQEVLDRFNLEQKPELLHPNIHRWEQDGGWYQVVSPDPWSQSGGWVLDLEGKVSMCPERPKEALVRDVWAAFDRVKPDSTRKNQAWGPLPQPKPGPCE